MTPPTPKYKKKIKNDKLGWNEKNSKGKKYENQ